MMIAQINLNVQSFQTSLNHGTAIYFILKGNVEAPPQLLVPNYVEQTPTVRVNTGKKCSIGLVHNF